MEFLESMKNMLRNSIPDLVIKYSGIAKQYETVETKRAGDRYVSAKLKTDSFASYPYFTKSALLAGGFSEKEATDYSKDKYKIPENRRKFAVQAMRNEIISTYVEGNDYYRMLNGYPRVDDYEEIWLEPEVYQRYGISPSPLHLINPDILTSMEALGELDYIKAQYPTKEYLEYVGYKRIDPSISRNADNYQILFFPRVDGGENFYRDFMNMYEECREYFLTVIYNQYYVANYDYYDNYIAFNILIMTINKLIPTMLERYVERDFYDAETIRVFLDAYGIEYNPIFTITQMKLIAKNLNVLLQSKSSDKVFIDILELIGYSNFSLMKYYLVKQHIFDADKKPVFHYKTITDEDGNQKQVLDESSMYEYYFVRTKVGTYNIQDALHDSSNIIDYKEVVTTDDHWIEDAELKEKLNNSEFNYIETKYMDMNVMYRMHSIVFETVYLTRMVLDKQSTKAIFVSLPSISTSQVSLFNVFILLICLLCKYYGMEPDLLTSPSKILHIMGFNFKADFESIKEEIRRRDDLDDRLIKYIKDITFTSPSDINKMYVNVRELEQLLVRLMNEAETHETYKAYDKLYKTLMWTELNNDIYKLSDGTIPAQFTDYLRESDPTLYIYYMTITDKDSISNATDYITSKLSNMFADTQYLNYIKIIDTTQLDAIRKLLCFFKSYTVTMRDTNLILRLDSRYYNMIHFSTYCNFSGDGPTKLYIPDSNIMDMLIDRIFKMKTKESMHDNIDLKDPMLVMVDNIMKLCCHFDFKPFASVDEKIINHIFVNGGVTGLFAENKMDGTVSIDLTEKWLGNIIHKHRLPLVASFTIHTDELVPDTIQTICGVSTAYIDESIRELWLAEQKVKYKESMRDSIDIHTRYTKTMQESQKIHDGVMIANGLKATSSANIIGEYFKLQDAFKLFYKLNDKIYMKFVHQLFHVIESGSMVDPIIVNEGPVGAIESLCLPSDTFTISDGKSIKSMIKQESNVSSRETMNIDNIIEMQVPDAVNLTARPMVNTRISNLNDRPKIKDKIMKMVWE